MSAIHTLLVPTDFSQESVNALHLALNIAKHTHAQIVLLHIIEIKKDKPESEFQLITKAQVKMNELVKNCQDISLRKLIIIDKVHACINRYAQDFPHCLIVMGSKGTNENAYLIGSNTEKIIRTAQRPVLAVKKRSMLHQKIKNICIASDFRHFPNYALAMIKDLQKAFQAILHLVKIITPNHFEISSVTLQGMREFANKSELIDYHIYIYNHYTEYDGILAFANEIQADIICMTTHGSTGFMHMIMGSVAEEVANQSEIPVLTFNLYAKS